MLLPSQRYDGEVGDFNQDMMHALQVQIFKLRKQWSQRRKREISQDLQTILAETPLGTGQLEAIDQLSKESLSWHSHLMDRPKMDGRLS